MKTFKRLLMSLLFFTTTVKSFRALTGQRWTKSEPLEGEKSKIGSKETILKLVEKTISDSESNSKMMTVMMKAMITKTLAILMTANGKS